MKKIVKNGANVSQKCAFASVSFIIRPNIFGNQK